MNPDASRILAASSAGLVQLWGGEIVRIDWPDEPRRGASGFPDSQVVVAGNFGTAVVHHNQLLLRSSFESSYKIGATAARPEHR